MPPVNDGLEIDLEDKEAVLKHVLKNLNNKCDVEATTGIPSIQLARKTDRIEYYTGLTNSIVQRLIEDVPERTTLSLDSRILILDTIRKLHTQHRSPTYNNIFEETSEMLKNHDGTPIEDNSEFLKQMRILGYLLKKTTNNTMILMEDPELRFERYMYLQKMKTFKNNSVQWPQIVYVDVRLIDLQFQFEKPMSSSSNLETTLNMNRSIFYHAVTKNGLLTGMFCNQDSFKKWITDVLLVHLKCPSVIIMNDFHDLQENNKPITRYHSKNDMLRWLTNNNIPCSSNMSKPALYELIAKYNEDKTEYQIDKILRSQGHEILRLPRQLYDLSITTPMWNNLKKIEEFHEATSIKDLQNMLMTQISLTTTSRWAEYEQEIDKYVTDIFEIETAIETFSDLYEIKT